MRSALIVARLRGSKVGYARQVPGTRCARACSARLGAAHGKGFQSIS